MIDPKTLREEDLDAIADTFRTPKECDDACFEIFVHNKWSLHKAMEWAKSESMLTKRAAFILMSALAKAKSDTPNFVFRLFLPVLVREYSDKRPEIQEAIKSAFDAIAMRNDALQKSVKEAKDRLI